MIPLNLKHIVTLIWLFWQILIPKDKRLYVFKIR